VDAVAALPEEVAASLLLVGEGPELQRLVNRARDLKAHLVTTGAVAHEDVPNYVAMADVCVASLPADEDLNYFSPLKALEYLAAGRPTIVATGGDMASLVEEGLALGYSPGDAGGLADALKMLFLDSALRDQLARKGRAFAKERTWRAAARSVAQAAGSLASTCSAV
jgi:glycosyltransferase involved in cell wall biosynthesis